MKLRYKLLATLISLATISPSVAMASEVIKYDDTNLDKIFIDNGISYDKKAVNKRIEDFKADPNNYIAPDYKVTKVEKSEEIIVDTKGEVKEVIKEKTTLKDQHPEPIYSKTPVYKKVVDISEHQDPNKIDYNKFAADIDGAILRTSITDAKTLNIRKDYALDRHYYQLNKRGVPLGFYHYSRAVNEGEAIREALYVTNILKDKNVSLPVYIDIEDDKRQAKASQGDISKAAEAFIETLNQNGYIGGIYSYPWFANKYLTHDVRNKYEFWIADYGSKGFTSYKNTDFDSWQFTHKSRVDGYKGNVDMSIVYKDYPYMISGRSYKPIDILVDEILAGKWGVGAQRARRLKYAGYNYDIIQAAVNARLKNA